MGNFNPVKTNGALPVTCKASGAITGGNVVYVDGDGTVKVAGADQAAWVGIAGDDIADTKLGPVWPIQGVVWEHTSTAGITAGAGVKPGASGEPVTGVIATCAAAGTLLGIALTTATGGNKFRWIGRQ